jgi:hypothetical protein
MRTFHRHRFVLSLALAAACSTSDEAGEATSGRGPSDWGGSSGSGSPTIPSTGNTGTNGGGDAGSRPVEDLPPERELSVSLQQPQASEHYVYAVNPSAGTVAIIDASTQAIRTIKTGAEPRYLRTLDGTDHAIVLNVGSNKASIVRMTDDKPSKSDLPVNAGANAIAVAPDGKHAVVYYNSTFASAGKSPGSYQDVAVLTISGDNNADSSVSMTVGFQPRDVFFDSQGTRAFVVTDDGVSVLSFDDIEKQGPGIAKLVTFGFGVDSKNLDVAITPDGRFGLARAEGRSELHLVELADGKVRTLDLATAYTKDPAANEQDAGVDELAVLVTDLDLMANGREALAALRNQSAVVRLPLPEAFDDPSRVQTIHVSGQVVGSLTVAPDGKSALAYTTAANIERIVFVDLDQGLAPRTVLLRKAVNAVAFTPDSSTAIITHEKLPGSPDEPGLSPEAQVDRSYGYSLLRLSSGDVKLQRTATQLGPIAIVPDASFLFILFRDDALSIKEVQRVALKSFLVDPIIMLENPPISMGVARASGAVFVNLEHPDGRMTFIDWQDPIEKLKTVTGFELNSRIRN